jgi:hypothetical protein
MRLTAGTTFAFLMITSVAFADDAVKSGPPVGARNNRGAFFPQHITGPGAGERRCPV